MSISTWQWQKRMKCMKWVWGVRICFQTWRRMSTELGLDILWSLKNVTGHSPLRRVHNNTGKGVVQRGRNNSAADLPFCFYSIATPASALITKISLDIVVGVFMYGSDFSSCHICILLVFLKFASVNTPSHSMCSHFGSSGHSADFYQGAGRRNLSCFLAPLYFLQRRCSVNPNIRMRCAAVSNDFIHLAS